MNWQGANAEALPQWLGTAFGVILIALLAVYLSIPPAKDANSLDVIDDCCSRSTCTGSNDVKAEPTPEMQDIAAELDIDVGDLHPETVSIMEQVVADADADESPHDEDPATDATNAQDEGAEDFEPAFTYSSSRRGSYCGSRRGSSAGLSGSQRPPSTTTSRRSSLSSQNVHSLQSSMDLAPGAAAALQEEHVTPQFMLCRAADGLILLASANAELEWPGGKLGRQAAISCLHELVATYAAAASQAGGADDAEHDESFLTKGEVTVHHRAVSGLLLLAAAPRDYPAALAAMLIQDARDVLLACAQHESGASAAKDGASSDGGAATTSDASSSGGATNGANDGAATTSDASSSGDSAAERRDWLYEQLAEPSRTAPWLASMADGMAALQRDYAQPAAPQNLARLLTGVAVPSPAALAKRDALFAAAAAQTAVAEGVGGEGGGRGGSPTGAGRALQPPLSPCRERSDSGELS
ncbi:hypothetical protein JKP88DRAFT_250715 [Tribonema minus]|uniref:Longin domain-containing protein n=1 Tax=Tribonema minus TaxID=303371 RepID=A0A836CPA5_9STRA|nr:hypothetical protein JKP88DRAFT_250715 [Tribonema minus]